MEEFEFGPSQQEMIREEEVISRVQTDENDYDF